MKTEIEKQRLRDYFKTEKGKAALKRGAEKQRKSGYRAAYRENRAEYFMHARAKHRAKQKGLPFTIKISDISIPEFCPVLGIPLKRGKKNSNSSPSLDRNIPFLGYTPENMTVISYRANVLKRDATVEEMERVLDYMKKIKEK